MCGDASLHYTCINAFSHYISCFKTFPVCSRAFSCGLLSLPPTCLSSMFLTTRWKRATWSTSVNHYWRTWISECSDNRCNKHKRGCFMSPSAVKADCQPDGYVCYLLQVARGYTNQGGLPHLRQHHPLLQPAGGTVPAADAGGVRHRRCVSSLKSDVRSGTQEKSLTRGGSRV